MGAITQEIPEEPSPALVDSAALRLDAETYYTAMRLRLLRWVRKNSGSVSMEVLGQSVDLLEQADKFAATEDYDTAQLILETAFKVANSSSAASPSSESLSPDEPEDSITPAWQWTREVVTGVDYWAQEFDLGFSEDSLFVEKNGNPFAGLRLNLGRANDLTNSFSAYSLIKTSRDYDSGELELRARRTFEDKSSGFLTNRSEATRYKRDLDLQYWQNTSLLGINFFPARQMRVEIEDEFRYRGYRQQSSVYPNYVHNQIRLGGSYLGMSTRIDAAYDYAIRWHPAFSENNYFEHRIEGAVYQATAANSSIYLQNIWRRRDYAQGFSDSTYQNTYQEEYLRGDVRIGLSPRFAIRVEGDYTLRQHDVPSSNTPDYSNTYLNPQLVFKLFGDWQVGAGYMYLLRVHAKDLVQKRGATAIDTRSPEAGFVGYEDYYSNGFTFSVELFQVNGLMLSVNNTYEMRKYPNSPTNDLTGLGFYTDRNINTLLLFLTVNLTPALQLSALANLDNDRSRVENQSDSKATLFSIDLGYSF
jgi:hypothetical protein